MLLRSYGAAARPHYGSASQPFLTAFEEGWLAEP
jgi:hypothetical protein